MIDPLNSPLTAAEWADYCRRQIAESRPPRVPAKMADLGKHRQTMLLAGLDCLPGQRDLFETDGPMPLPPSHG